MEAKTELEKALETLELDRKNNGMALEREDRQSHQINLIKGALNALRGLALAGRLDVALTHVYNYSSSGEIKGAAAVALAKFRWENGLAREAAQAFVAAQRCARALSENMRAELTQLEKALLPETKPKRAEATPARQVFALEVYNKGDETLKYQAAKMLFWLAQKAENIGDMDRWREIVWQYEPEFENSGKSSKTRVTPPRKRALPSAGIPTSSKVLGRQTVLPGETPEQAVERIMSTVRGVVSNNRLG